MKNKHIFSGDYSRDMWDAINNADTVEELKDALYFVCCRLQELERKFENELSKKRYKHGKEDVIK